jgi:ferredoxin-NADP reductase
MTALELKSLRCGGACASLFVVLIAATAAAGQPAIDGRAWTLSQLSADHSEHHPGAAPGNGEKPAAPAPAAPALSPNHGSTPGASPQAAMPGMGQPGSGPAGMGMMSGMGEMMGRPRKEFYPSLMTLPPLTPEQRRDIEAQARARISAGTDGFANAESALRHAYAAGDLGGIQQAASRLRDALNQVESGAIALRSLAEDKPPQQVGLDWFKKEMGLPPNAPADVSAGLFGISWPHLIAMALVSAFATALFVIYLGRMRRANALVDRLTAATNASPVRPPSPTASAVPPPAASGLADIAVPAAQAAPVADAEARRPGPWKGKLRVAAVFNETPDVKTFRLRDPNGGPIPFTFVPGQFLTYSAEIDGKPVKRSYTIASSAAQTAYVDTTVKRERQAGGFSEYLHTKIAEGDLIEVLAPLGGFTFTGKEADSVVLIGGGVGITPLMAAIRYLADTAWPGEIFLVYGAQSTEHFIFRDELEFLQRRMGNLHVAATMARAAGASWMGAEGMITKPFLLQSVPDLAKRRVHLCGPPGMMEAIKAQLAEIGLPAEKIKTEAFGPARGAVPPPAAKSANGQSTGTSGASSLLPSAIGLATSSITFARSNKVAPLPPDRSVLEAAESIGVPIDYSCRAGICGVCKTKLLEGRVTMEVEEALTDEDRTKDIILACQAKSIGNLTVEA